MLHATYLGFDFVKYMLKEKFEDTKGVIKGVTKGVIKGTVDWRNIDNTMIKKKRTKGQTMIYKKKYSVN